MGMMLAGIDLQLAIHLLSQLRLWQHARNGELDHPFRTRFSHTACPSLDESSWVASVPTIQFLAFFAARQLDLGGIHNNHVVTGVQGWGENRFMLTHQEHSDPARDPAEDGVTRVYHVPGTTDLVLGRNFGARGQTYSLRSKTRTIQSTESIT
jgi:hypothetical protein